MRNDRTGFTPGTLPLITFDKCALETRRYKAACASVMTEVCGFGRIMGSLCERARKNRRTFREPLQIRAQKRNFGHYFLAERKIAELVEMGWDSYPRLIKSSHSDRAIQFGSRAGGSPLEIVLSFPAVGGCGQNHGSCWEQRRWQGVPGRIPRSHGRSGVFVVA